jgi:hypothetical protein
MRFFAASIIALACAASHAAAQPARVTAEYKVTSSGMTIGSVKETFLRTGDTYSIESVTRTEGPLKIILDEELTLKSTGKVGPKGLQPLQFGLTRVKDTKRDVKSTFDWDKGVMRVSLRGENSETAIPRDTQDRLSVMYQFMSLRDTGDGLSIPMAEGRKVQMFSYRLVEEGKLSTPAGEFDTRHYQRVIYNSTDTRVDVWLAKDRYNFPVRVIFDDPKGYRLDQVIASLETR